MLLYLKRVYKNHLKLKIVHHNNLSVTAKYYYITVIKEPNDMLP